MRTLALGATLMSTVLVLPAVAASKSTSNTTCGAGKTVLVSVPASKLPPVSSIVTAEPPVLTTAPVPEVSLPIYGPDATFPLASATDSTEEITTVIIRTGPTKTITRSLRRVAASGATLASAMDPKSVDIPSLASIPDAVVPDETAMGVPIATTVTTVQPQSGSTTERPSATSVIDLGSDSIVTISKSLGSDSFVEWTKTIALAPSLPDLIEPTSGDFTVSFGASTTMFFTPEASPGPSSSSLESIATLSAPTPESSTGWETVWGGKPEPVETALPVLSTVITSVPETNDSGVLETLAEPTSTVFVDIPPSVAVPSISLITVAYAFPAYSTLESLVSTADVTISPPPSQTPATAIFTLTGDELRQPRVVTLTTSLPFVDGTPWLMTSPSKSVTDVVVTYTMPGGYGHSSSVVTFTTSKPISTDSRVKSSPSISWSKTRASSVEEPITIVTYGPWPSPTPSLSKTLATSSKNNSPTSVSFSTGGSRHTSHHGTGTSPFTNSTISGSMSVTIAPSGSGIQPSAVTGFPSASHSRNMLDGTGVSISSPITSSRVTSRSLKSSSRRTTSVETGIIPSGDTFTSAVDTPLRPSRRPTTTAPSPGSANMTETGSVFVPNSTDTTQFAQSSINATASVSGNSTRVPLTGGEILTTQSIQGEAGQSASANSTAFGISAQVTQPSGPGQGGINTTGRSRSTATSSSQAVQSPNGSAAASGTSPSIVPSSSVLPLNGTLAAGSGLFTSTRASMTPGSSAASLPLATSSPPTAGSSSGVNSTAGATSTRRGQTQGDLGNGSTLSVSLATSSTTTGGPNSGLNSTSVSGDEATTSTRGQTQGGPGNVTISNPSLATASVGTPKEQNGTLIPETPSASTTLRGQTQAGPGLSTSLPDSTGTAVGPVQSQNATLSLSASSNSTLFVGATTASLRTQGQGEVDKSTDTLSNTSSSETLATTTQVGALPSQSQDLPKSTNATSSADTTRGPTISRVRQTVGSPLPTSSLNGTTAANSTIASSSRSTTNSTSSTRAGQGGNPSSVVSSSDTSTQTSRQAAQSQGGDFPASTGSNDTTAVTSSLARQPQSQGAAGTSPTATWPPMNTQSVNGINANSTSMGAESSSAAPSSSQGSAPDSTTSIPRGQGGQGGQPTQTAIASTAGNTTLISQTSNSTATASSVDQNPQSPTTLATVVNPGTNSTTAIPATGTGSPLFCGNEWDRGNETINFDDRASLQWPNPTSGMPLFVPYHRLYFSEGFTIVPPPNQTHNPSSGNNMTMWSPPNSSVPAVGQIGFGPLRENSCFRFNLLSFDLGCNTTENYCHFNVSGLRYDGLLDEERQVSQFEISFPSCRANNFTNCSLTTVNLGRYNLTDLSSITFDNIGNSSRVWFGDDLEFAWTNDTCEAGRCRALVPNLSHRVRAAHFRSPRRTLLHHESTRQEATVPLSASQWFRTILGAA